MKPQTIQNKLILSLICIFFTLLSTNIRSQYTQIKHSDLEKINNSNKKKGLPENHNIFHKFTFEVENFEDFKPNYNAFASKLKKDISIEDLYFQNDKIYAICDEKNASKFLQILKKNIHLFNNRLYKISEDLLEKNEIAR